MKKKKKFFDPSSGSKIEDLTLSENFFASDLEVCLQKFWDFADRLYQKRSRKNFDQSSFFDLSPSISHQKYLLNYKPGSEDALLEYYESLVISFKSTFPSPIPLKKIKQKNK